MDNQKQKMKILLICSNADDVRFIFEVFNTEKPGIFEITHASNLEGAMEYLQKQSFELILLDIPASSEGLNEVRALLKAKPAQAVVVMIEKDNESFSAQCMEERIQDCISKEQMSAVSLVRAVQYALIRHQRIRKFAEATVRLQSVEESLRNIMQENSQAVVIVDMDGVVRFVNKAAEMLFNRSREGMEGEMFEFSVIPDKTTEIQILKVGGAKIYVEMRAIAIEWEGQIVYLVSLYDITELVRIREDLRALGWLDATTGLYSHKGFSMLGEQLLQGARRSMKELSLIYVHFANIEDIKKRGPHESESAIEDLAAMIKKTFSSALALGRLAEDKFYMLLSTSEAQALCVRLKDVVDVHGKTARKGYSISVTTKVIVYNPRVSATIDSLIAQAEK